MTLEKELESLKSEFLSLREKFYSSEKEVKNLRMVRRAAKAEIDLTWATIYLYAGTIRQKEEIIRQQEETIRRQAGTIHQQEETIRQVPWDIVQAWRTVQRIIPTVILRLLYRLRSAFR